MVVPYWAKTTFDLGGCHGQQWSNCVSMTSQLGGKLWQIFCLVCSCITVTIYNIRHLLFVVRGNWSFDINRGHRSKTLKNTVSQEGYSSLDGAYILYIEYKITYCFGGGSKVNWGQQWKRRLHWFHFCYIGSILYHIECKSLFYLVGTIWVNKGQYIKTMNMMNFKMGSVDLSHMWYAGLHVEYNAYQPSF